MASCFRNHRRPSGPESRREDRAGFVLIFVLWMLVLLALVTTHMTALGGGEARATRALIDEAQAEAAADGAIYGAIARAPALDMTAGVARLPLTVGGVAVTVLVSDESARLNVNTASEASLRALIQLATGMDQARAETLAQAITAWRNGSLSKPAAASIRAAYIATGKRYGPPFEPFRSLDELGLVLGMTPAVLQRLTPHLSLYALDTGSATDPLVAEARGTAGPAPTAPPWPRVVAIDALAYGAHGTAFRRHAVARLDPGQKPVYTILDWTRSWGPMSLNNFTKN